MIKILIIDDDSNKIGQITNEINTFPEISKDQIFTVSDLISARRELIENQFDLMIIDLNLPERFGDDPKENAGLDLIYEIKLSPRYKKPFHVIGITAYPKLKEKFEHDFQDELWLILHFESDQNNWSQQLNNKLRYLIDSKNSLIHSVRTNYDFDLAIITAVPTIELTALLNINCNWEKYQVAGDSTVYYKGIFVKNDKRLRIVAACTAQMGMIASSVLTTKIIHKFFPKFIAISGIAAGIAGKGNYGDLLIADHTWDYGYGKIDVSSDGSPIFLPDPKTLQLDSFLKEKFIEIQRERRYLSDIRNLWQGNKPTTSIEILLGPFASGSFLVNNEVVLDQIISHNRKLIGIDMEAYGIFYAAYNSIEPRPMPFSIKSISDFGFGKHKEFQRYAAFVSSNYLLNFAIDELV